MEEQKTTNGSEQSQLTPTNPYMTFYKEISAAEAQPLMKRVRIDKDLHEYIMRMLNAVRDDYNKRIPVPADFPLALRALKASIKKVARKMDIPVRFDPSTDGGFFVRKASVDEQVKGDRQGARLGERRRKK